MKMHNDVQFLSKQFEKIARANAVLEDLDRDNSANEIFGNIKGEIAVTNMRIARLEATTKELSANIEEGRSCIGEGVNPAVRMVHVDCGKFAKHTVAHPEGWAPVNCICAKVFEKNGNDVRVEYVPDELRLELDEAGRKLPKKNKKKRVNWWDGQEKRQDEHEETERSVSDLDETPGSTSLTFGHEITTPLYEPLNALGGIGEDHSPSTLIDEEPEQKEAKTQNDEADLESVIEGRDAVWIDGELEWMESPPRSLTSLEMRPEDEANDEVD